MSQRDVLERMTWRETKKEENDFHNSRQMSLIFNASKDLADLSSVNTYYMQCLEYMVYIYCVNVIDVA